MNWLDYVFIIFLIISGLSGLFNGMLKAFIKLASLVVAFYAAITYHQSVALWLADQWGLADALAQMIKPLVKLPGALNSPEILKMPVDILQKISSEIQLPSQWSQIIAQLGQFGPNETVGHALNLMLAQGILKIIAFIGIYIIVKTIIGIIAWLLGIIMPFSPLGPLDKLGGLLLGLTCGAIAIVVIISILIPLQGPVFLFGGSEGLLSTLAQGIEQSIFVQRLGPMIKKLNWYPNLLPDISNQFLFKYIPKGPGTQI
ncbi:CvpA family protein [Desulfotomaculum sp. 1211_IL3151]|uniref:CvpA family protein n=1 Tax=Desulfotomaculum sp. 1211_IL3151 TaxID=3084055 RepID=UPI002FDB1F8F